MQNDNDITYLARLNFRNDRRMFGIRRRDRRSHIYLIGKTGVGKSTFLDNMLRQDIANGEGLALVDPHGDLVEQIQTEIPMHRRQDVVWFNVPDRNQTLGFNPLWDVPPIERPLVASDLLDVFKKIWSDSWGPRLEHILRNVLMALLDQGNATLGDVNRLLSDKLYRHDVAMKTFSPAVRAFWLKEYEGYPDRFRAEAIAPLQNKIGAFLSNPVLNRILTRENTLDLRTIMDTGKILLVNLAKGKAGEDTAALLGALLVAKLGRVALRRADTPEEQRLDFHVYLDEFQTLATPSLASMLSELRKYRMNLILAHQFLSQLDEGVRDSILGNVGTMIVFRVGLTDAEILAKEFYPEFDATDLVNLPNHNFCLKLMVDGAVSKGFSGATKDKP